MNFEDIVTRQGKINMYWYKMPDGSTNFGDELNPFVIHELTGREIRFIPYPYKWYKIIYRYLRAFLSKSTTSDFRGAIRSIFAKNVLFGIGSIIHIYDRKGVIVWGSGMMYLNRKINNANFCAVRGVETKKEITNQGLKSSEAIGDPALLLPLLISPCKKKDTIGIIPHYVQYEELLQYYSIPHKFLVINLKENIHKIIEQITSCEYIISSSLHGLIVAHSYKIPALWVEFKSKNKLPGNNVKFRDYFSSIGINYYEPIRMQFLDREYIIELMSEYSEKAMMKIEIVEIQKNLLKNAPFQLKEQYRIFL